MRKEQGSFSPLVTCSTQWCFARCGIRLASSFARLLPGEEVALALQRLYPEAAALEVAESYEPWEVILVFMDGKEVAAFN